jgi:hypothetical protein
LVASFFFTRYFAGSEAERASRVYEREEIMALYAIVKRGQNKGIRVEPHRYKDGTYHVARKKEDPFTRVALDEIVPYIQRGYGLRMSNKPEEHRPGLFMPNSIDGWR